MDIQSSVLAAQKSTPYLAWKKDHPLSFLSYVFLDGENEQIGFYDEKADKVFSLTLNPEMQVIHSWEDVVFRDPEKKIQPLALEHVTLTTNDIKNKAMAFFTEKYKNIPLTRTLSVLEMHEPLGVVWNITFVTQSLLLVIIKLHPGTGELLEEKKTTLTV